MTTITGSDTYFTSVDVSLAAATWEAFIDQAIDEINGYASDYVLPNMGGTAGSKSVSVGSTQAGWIRKVAVAIYLRDYRNVGADSQSVSVGSVSLSSSRSGAGVEALAREAARHIKEIEVSYG